MHHAPPFQPPLGHPLLQQPQEINARRAAVQEERQVRFGCDIELGREVGELHVFGREGQAVVVEADFAECDGAFLRRGGEGEGAELREVRGGGGEELGG